MGTCWSKGIPNEGTPVSESKPNSDAEYKVMVFAVMRNTHEGIRGCLTTMQEDAAAVAEGRFSKEKAAKAKASLDTLLKLITLHTQQEDKVLFPFLNSEFDGTAQKEGLSDQHAKDTKLQQALTAAGNKMLKGRELGKYRELAKKFGAHHLEQLEHEEQVVMPLIQKIEPESRLTEVVREIIMCNWAAQGDFVPRTVVKQMAARSPYPSLRMYVAALQRVLTSVEYEAIVPGLQEAAGEKWEQLEEHGLAGPGLFQEKE